MARTRLQRRLTSGRCSAERGATLVEVLVAVLIIAIGLLSLGVLQLRLQVSEMESYQRAQALVLLQDMAASIEANRTEALSYVTGSTPTGTGADCAVAAASPTGPQVDLAAWCSTLQGAAERLGTARAGAMLGARGCVAALGAGVFRVTVAWQGLTGLAAPPANVDCGKFLYDGDANSGCSNDRCRRAVTTLVRIGSLT